MALQTNRPGREPERFAAGDTLWYLRRLPAYPAGQGWHIQGTVTSPGGQLVAQFVSTAEGDDHEVQEPAFLLEAAPGDYVLSEEIVNPTLVAGQVVRHQIYYENLTVGPDLADGAAPGPILTFAQRMVAALEEKMLYLEGINLTETEQHRTRFVIEAKNDTLKRLNHWYEKRNWEVQMERARNGGRPGNTIRPVFGIG